ncbi:MAG: zinc metalloprotease HtpX [candidate division Zixibacteria bacterium]|nr:zinc metalloprotease HtpX [candidate division Zixibacteria bacterium]
MNSFKVFLLMIVLMFLFVWIGYTVGGQSGMIIAFGLAVVMNFFSYWFSDRIILKIYHAKRVTEHDHPRLFSIVNRVRTAAMVPMPKVYIVSNKAPNAFATGRNAENAAVAVTEGLLEILNDDELEGVLSHEFAHIINKDMLLGTIVATFVGAIGILASIARWGAILGGYGRSDNRGGLVGLLATAIVAPLTAILIQAAISRRREFKADAVGAKLTGRYRGLSSALKKISSAPNRMNLNRKPAAAHLMIVKPFSGKFVSSLFSTHPPVEKRIEKLNELSQKM